MHLRNDDRIERNQEDWKAHTEKHWSQEIKIGNSRTILNECIMNADEVSFHSINGIERKGSKTVQETFQ